MHVDTPVVTVTELSIQRHEYVMSVAYAPYLYQAMEVVMSLKALLYMTWTVSSTKKT